MSLNPFRVTIRVTVVVLIASGLLYGGWKLGAWLSTPAGEPTPADIIVVLGGDDGDRVIMAAEIYKAGYAKWILMTGMYKDDVNAQSDRDEWRVKFLVQQGIPEQVILYDDQAVNTHQEALITASLLEKRHWSKALVISNPPHMRRLEMSWRPIFEKRGLQFQLIQTRSPHWNADRWWEDEKWAWFCVKEAVKLMFYLLVYHD